MDLYILCSILSELQNHSVQTGEMKDNFQGKNFETIQKPRKFPPEATR